MCDMTTATEQYRRREIMYNDPCEEISALRKDRDQLRADLAAERDAKYRALTVAADYAEERDAARARVAELEKSAHESSGQEGKLAHMLNQAQSRVAELERDIAQAECEGAKWIGSRSNGMVVADLMRVVGEEPHAVAEQARARVALLEGLLDDIRDRYRDHDGPTWDRIDAALSSKEPK